MASERRRMKAAVAGLGGRWLAGAGRICRAARGHGACRTLRRGHGCPWVLGAAGGVCAAPWGGSCTTGSCAVGREPRSGAGAVQWGGNRATGREECNGEKSTYRGGNSAMGGELCNGELCDGEGIMQRGAVQWGRSCAVGRELPCSGEGDVQWGALQWSRSRAMGS